MANAYFNNAMLLNNEKSVAGVAWRDDDNGVVRIVPVESSMMDEVVLGQSDIVGLMHVALLILSDDDLCSLKEDVENEIVRREVEE